MSSLIDGTVAGALTSFGPLPHDAHNIRVDELRNPTGRSEPAESDWWAKQWNIDKHGAAQLALLKAAEALHPIDGKASAAVMYVRYEIMLKEQKWRDAQRETEAKLRGLEVRHAKQD